MLNLPTLEQPLITIIQTVLAPALMISGCALLLSGINNKYSLVVTRIRFLDEEKRKIWSDHALGKHTAHSTQRLSSIELQMNQFRSRVRLVRNAVICYCIAISFFVISSLTVGLTFTSIGHSIDVIVLSLFFTGMISVLCGISFTVREIIRGYQIITIEIEETAKMVEVISEESKVTHSQSSP